MINELKRMENLYETLASNSYVTDSCILTPVEKSLSDRIKSLQAVSNFSLNFKNLRAFISY